MQLSSKGLAFFFEKRKERRTEEEEGFLLFGSGSCREGEKRVVFRCWVLSGKESYSELRKKLREPSFFCKKEDCRGIKKKEKNLWCHSSFSLFFLCSPYSVLRYFNLL